MASLTPTEEDDLDFEGDFGRRVSVGSSKSKNNTPDLSVVDGMTEFRCKLIASYVTHYGLTE